MSAVFRYVDKDGDSLAVYFERDGGLTIRVVAAMPSRECAAVAVPRELARSLADVIQKWAVMAKEEDAYPGIRNSEVKAECADADAREVVRMCRNLEMRVETLEAAAPEPIEIQELRQKIETIGFDRPPSKFLLARAILRIAKDFYGRERKA
jgi:hypothetical protein